METIVWIVKIVGVTTANDIINLKSRILILQKRTTMKTNRLVIIMGKIARQLIKSNYISDFNTHDTSAIEKTEGKIRFIWQVRDTGTWLYLYNKQDWAERLIERIDYYKGAGISNIYYYYNKKKLVPIFESDVRFIAKKHIELRQKLLSTNTEE